ncbi:hypothetical protein B296_00059229 [Ensete ventricosum]|uniref:Uncharacterized protein n=1 Tax=Ensete ventricosum TaxID=4639 RepID=A0A426XIM9_ENSVE|nr:hypothetical protein B296_00059229 [Ensete ventricosum]
MLIGSPYESVTPEITVEVRLSIRTRPLCRSSSADTDSSGSQESPPEGVRPEAGLVLVDSHIPMIPASSGRGPSRTEKTSYSLGWLASADMLEEHHWIKSILVARSLYARLGS